MKSLFIVFEGIDGSGTSTQANLLKNYFLNNSIKSIVTSEPSEGPIGNIIRQGMKQRIFFTNNKRHFDQQMAYLFAADRHDHLYNQIDGVFKKVEEGFQVISTRYFFSSFAYHCDDEEDLELVTNLNNKFPNPDIVIYIDNPIEVSLERISQRSVQDVYENKEKLVKVKNNYEEIFSKYSGNLIKVKGNNDPMVIHNQIINYIEEVYNG
ncbi:MULTISPECIES: dTMP kinase [Pontibacillus]|uniref:Thymidylate kinase n=1 Tax=Pontibacillus chungwhensis TaxID=265426 RepID=A0ABY8UXL2_9BACI|nr:MULTISPECIES: dTMP kinase [Pontibacillus]MCD5325949.1 dTMP kinase [Pontibacillus sp. HN14]WIF98406.1 dTMP kinase [Pontibacillus chungwhensis]